jgi:hypothetical protein
MTYYYYNSTADAAWNSQNSNVATVNSGTVKGVSGGTSLVTAQYSDYGEYVDYPILGCQGTLLSGNPGSTANVLTPYAAVVLNTVVQGAAGANLCGSLAGWEREVTMQLQDQSGKAIPVSGITMADQISVSTPNPLGVSTAAGGSTSTNSSGTWPDLYVVCSSACPGSTGEADAIQSWTWSGAPLPHSNYVVYKCNSITSDGR